MRRNLVGRSAWLAAVMLLLGSVGVPAQSSFPFDHELLLDAAPMKGSKRVPSLDIAANGTAEIALWCDTVKAQLIVAADTITVIAGPGTGQQCPPERMRGDEDLLSALTQVTNWRREGNYLVLTGGRTIRFHLQTN
jgi:heat shock protein HslJ